MKRTILHKTAALCAAFLILTLGVFAQSGSVIQPTAGTVYTYDVKTNTQMYTLAVKLVAYHPGLKLEWKTSGAVNQNGTITVSNADASDAKAFSTVFTGGNTTLAGKSTVWLSQMVYKLLKVGKPVSVFFDNAGTADELRNVGTGTMEVMVNGVATQVPYIKATSTGKQILLQDAIHNALVLSLHTDAGLVMELKSITQ
jgi:hypothetical protein